MKADRVVFNALIAACAQSGAMARAFDVIAEMEAEIHPIVPDHVTFGTLMKACAKAGQVWIFLPPFSSRMKIYFLEQFLCFMKCM